MTIREDALTRECRVFTRYLVGTAPTDYVIDRYVDAHRVSAAYASDGSFDDMLVAVSRKHTLLTKLVDSYACVLSPTAVVRRKLILLLAILETCAPSSSLIDRAAGSNLFVLSVRLGIRGLGSVISLIVGTMLFFPARLILSGRSRAGG